MAHFYATIKGNRGEASRMGTKDSGIVSYTASWFGAIRTQLWYDEEKDCDMVKVEMVPWRGFGERRHLYTGRVNGK